MFKLEIPFKNVDKLWVAENEDEANQCIENDDTFILWTKGQKTLEAIILKPLLEKHMPGINWSMFFKWSSIEDRPYIMKNKKKDINKVEGRCSRTKHDTSADVAKKRRKFSGQQDDWYEKINVEDYVGNNSTVDVDMLLHMKLLPSSLFKVIEGMIGKGTEVTFNENYDKKRDIIGGFSYDDEGNNNLIIIDISHSIPLGISSTLLVIAESLKNNLDADMIITGSKSYFYPKGTPLPTPNEIRRKISRSNESTMFCNILKEHIVGTHWSNVFSFGDFDSPLYEADFQYDQYDLKVDNLYHFHTTRENKATGYAKWANPVAKHIEYNTSWCSFMTR